jgi:hypothetical protein
MFVLFLFSQFSYSIAINEWIESFEKAKNVLMKNKFLAKIMKLTLRWDEKGENVSNSNLKSNDSTSQWFSQFQYVIFMKCQRRLTSQSHNVLWSMEISKIIRSNIGSSSIFIHARDEGGSRRIKSYVNITQTCSRDSEIDQLCMKFINQQRQLSKILNFTCCIKIISQQPFVASHRDTFCKFLLQ